MNQGTKNWPLFAVGWLVAIVVLASLMIGWITKHTIPDGCASAVRYVVYLRSEGNAGQLEHLFRVSVLSTNKTVEFVSRVPGSLLPRLPSNQTEACRAVGLGA